MMACELIHVLETHQPGMAVVPPADDNAWSDFTGLGAVEADGFWPDPTERGTLQLAELRNRGAVAAVRRCGKG
jgi:hypothetical protein